MGKVRIHASACVSSPPEHNALTSFRQSCLPRSRWAASFKVKGRGKCGRKPEVQQSGLILKDFLLLRLENLSPCRSPRQKIEVSLLQPTGLASSRFAKANFLADLAGFLENPNCPAPHKCLLSKMSAHLCCGRNRLDPLLWEMSYLPIFPPSYVAMEPSVADLM